MPVETLKDDVALEIASHVTLGEWVDILLDFASWSASKLSGTGQPRLHIVSAVEDFECFAVPLIERLEAAGKDVVFSCVWPQLNRIRLDGSMEIAPITMSYDQARFQSDSHLVLVSSVVSSTTILESMMLHALSSQTISFEQISVVAPLYSKGNRSEFAQAVPQRNLESLKWIGYAEGSLTATKAIRMALSENIASYLNVESPQLLTKYLPSSIQRLIDAEPRYVAGYQP